MKAKGKKASISSVTINKENENKTLSSTNLVLSSNNTISSIRKKANSSCNLSKTINHSINPNNNPTISNNINTKIQNDKVLTTPRNNRVIKTTVKEENVSTNNKARQSKLDSSKNLNIVVTRRDSKGIVIYKGSKMHHLIFKDCLENKKPLVEVINVESFKKENVNEFLTEDYYEYENSDDKYTSNSCTIF